jgi:hypothetical protein
MTSIAKQNTIEALNIYHKAQTNKWEVRVSESGNVRIASWTDRFKSGFRAIFNPRRERTNWDEKAKLAIQHKLFGEVSLFQEKIEVKSVKSLLKNIFLLDIKNPEPNFKTILENSNLLKTNEDIKQLWDIKDKKIYSLVVEELMNTPNSDLRKATNVANYTAYLIKEFGLSKKDATEASRKTCIAMEEFKFEFKEAYKLARLTENLINKKHIGKDLPLKLQLSASLAFMDLLNKGGNKKEAIAIVKNRIELRNQIKKNIPEDMPIPYIHEGKVYEYKISFSEKQKEKIAENLKTQLDEPLCKEQDKIEFSNLISSLDAQCIKDATRSRSNFSINGKDTNTQNNDAQSNQLKITEKYMPNGFLNEEFENNENSESNPESNKKIDPNLILLKDSFITPLEKFQLQSNLSTKNISDISHFLSQTTFGTLLTFSFQNSNSFISNVGDPEKAKVLFEVNLIENETEERDRRIILSATQYTDGDNLRIKHQPDENTPAKFTLLPINQVLNKGEKASSEKFVQEINMEYEILINEDDEIKIRVIDAGIFYKFTINESVLDNMPREEVLS